MNTLVRSVSTRFLPTSATLVKPSSVKLNFVLVILCLSILLSAFGVVYMKDYNRRQFITYQQLQQTQQQYETDWGKLLLEQSTWAAQARVQAIAQQQLDMVMPKPQDTIILAEN